MCLPDVPVDALGREVAVYLNRQGKVLQVSVGDTDTVDLPEFIAP